MIGLGLLALMALQPTTTPLVAVSPGDCPGGYQIVRTSRVKPGQGELFARALKDQQAWYAAKGMPDRIYAGRQITPYGPSPDIFVTVHTRIANPAMPDANDKQWNAFIDEFHRSSDILTGSLACMSLVGK